MNVILLFLNRGYKMRKLHVEDWKFSLQNVKWPLTVGRIF